MSIVQAAEKYCPACMVCVRSIYCPLPEIPIRRCSCPVRIDSELVFCEGNCKGGRVLDSLFNGDRPAAMAEQLLSRTLCPSTDTDARFHGIPYPAISDSMHEMRRPAMGSAGH